MRFVREEFDPAGGIDDDQRRSFFLSRALEQPRQECASAHGDHRIYTAQNRRDLLFASLETPRVSSVTGIRLTFRLAMIWKYTRLHPIQGSRNDPAPAAQPDCLRPPLDPR